MIELQRPTEQAWQRAVVERFHAEQDLIRVDLLSSGGRALVDQMLTLLAAGDPPDIGYHDPPLINIWGSRGIAKDIRPYLEREGAASPFSEFLEPSMNLFAVEGRQYGIPFDVQITAFLYSETAFDQAGVAYPTEGWTWDDVAAEGRKLTYDRSGDGQIDQWGTMFPPWWLWEVMHWAFGGATTDRPQLPTAFTGDAPASIAFLNFAYDLIHGRNVMAAPSAVSTNVGLNIVEHRNVAMAVGHTFYIQYMVGTDSDVRWNVTRLPRGPAGNTSLINSLGWFIFEEARQPDAAWEVLKYFSSEESMTLASVMHGALVPHRQATLSAWMSYWEQPENRVAFLDSIPGARGVPNLIDQGGSAVTSNINAIMLGQKAIAQALAEMRLGVESWLAMQKEQRIR